MQKVVCYRSGGYDQLKVENGGQIPSPKEDEVLVEVKFIGVNYADVCVRMGLYSSAAKYVGWPIIVG